MKEIKLGYYLIGKYDDYSVLVRNTDFEPYVVVSNLTEDGNWFCGKYFSDLFDAVDYAKLRGDENHISYSRMSEIATKAIDGLFEDDEETAVEYCDSEIEMSDEEKEYFGIYERMEQDE